MSNVIKVIFFSVLFFSANAQSILLQEENIHLLSPHPDDSILTFGGMLGTINKENGDKFIHYHVYTNITSYVVTPDSPSVETATGRRLLEDVSAFDFLLKSSSGKRYYSYSAFNQVDNLAGDVDFSQFDDNAKINFNETYSQLYSLMKSVSEQGKSCAFYVNSALPNPSGHAHTNHFILREATLKAAHDLGSNYFKCSVYLGEDLPYYINNETGSVEEINTLTNRLGLSVEDIDINVEKKMEAVNKYPSQLTSDYERAVRIRAQQLGNKERTYKINLRFDDIKPDASCNNESFCSY